MPSTSSSGMKATNKIIVLGGGVVGVTTAYFLAREGYDVELIEQNDATGFGTSRANGGLVSVGCSQPWNSPSVPFTVLKSWGRVDSPFLFRMSAFPGVIPWGLKYLLQCRADSYARSSTASVQILSDSLARLRGLVEETQLQYDKLQNGVLKFFGSLAELEREAALTRQLSHLGLEFKSMSVDEIIALEPLLEAQRSQIAGGLYFVTDESGDAHKFTHELARKTEDLGVKFHYSTKIEKIVENRGRISHLRTSRGDMSADLFVLALGPAAANLARPLGVKLPVYPVKGYSVTIETHGNVPLPKTPFLDWSRKMGITAFGTRIRAGGTAEFAGYNTEPRRERWEVLHRNMLELFPSLADAPEADIMPWAGLRPVTPDGMSILGKSPVENLMLNVGHGPQGWGLSCGCAAFLTDLIAGRETAVSAAPFAYSRF